MASYEEFLRLIKEGWDPFVKLPHFEVIEKHGGGSRGVATGAGVIIGGVAGGLVGYALSGGSKTQQREIETIVRIPEKGIVIEKATDEGKDLRIPWEKVKNMEKGWNTYAILNLIDGTEISMTVPWVKTGFMQKYRFMDELINYVNERAAGQVEEGW